MRRTNAPNTGEIYLAEIPHRDNINSGKRPVIIAQNDVGNMFSPNVHVIPLTRQMRRAGTQPTHVTIYSDDDNKLRDDSVALVEDMVPIPAECLIGRIGRVGCLDLERLKAAFRVQFPLAGG